QSDASTLAVIGFGKVDELEVERKSARKQNSSIHRQRVNELECRGGLPRRLLLVAAGLRIAATNGALPQRFNMREEVFARLLPQHFAQQNAKRADVAAQRSL